MHLKIESELLRSGLRESFLIRNKSSSFKGSFGCLTQVHILENITKCLDVKLIEL